MKELKESEILESLQSQRPLKFLGCIAIFFSFFLVVFVGGGRVGKGAGRRFFFCFFLGGRAGVLLLGMQLA